MENSTNLTVENGRDKCTCLGKDVSSFRPYVRCKVRAMVVMVTAAAATAVSSRPSN